MNKNRSDALTIWNAAVDAVRPRPLVSNRVQVCNNELQIGDKSWGLDSFDRVVVVGAGKAGTEMCKGLLNALPDTLPVIGWINVPEGTEKDFGTNITIHPARPAGLNEPTESGVEGTQKILDLVRSAKQSDLCIALISGGGSALLPAPAKGISLNDKLAVIRHLSGAGANIAELNTVRKHLSQVKGGGLAAACNAGDLITLVLSDVLGDPLDLIASGPTIPDPSSPQDAIDVLRRFDPDQELPDHIISFLKQAEPKRQDFQSTVFVVGNNRTAVDAASAQAANLNYKCFSDSATQCEGDAADIGKSIANNVLDQLRRNPVTQPTCLVSGGEPTVQLAPQNIRGKGGRNQQLVLASYVHLLDQQLTEEEWKRVVILSGGTDGEDGPTDAAGGLIDSRVHAEICHRGLDVSRAIKTNDAYTLLNEVDGLITTGPTGTNVCDVRVATILPN